MMIRDSPAVQILLIWNLLIGCNQDIEPRRFRRVQQDAVLQP